MANEGTIDIQDGFHFDASVDYTPADIRSMRLKMGLVFQQFNLFPQYTALENVYLPLHLRKKEEIRSRVPFGKQRRKAFADALEKDKEYARTIIQKSLSKQFAPEFLNRLDEIITFDQLDLVAIKRIIDIELRSLSKRMENLNVKMEITDSAKDFVATKGYDVQFGARPLKRAIQNYIEDGVCDILLGKNDLSGFTIKIDKEINKSELSFTLMPDNESL
jgi:ATP-dependent protease Clp ATPase subunit